MRSRKRAFVISLLIGVATLMLAALPVPFVEFLMLPGVLVASLFWPQGIHSDGMGPVGAVLFIITLYAGTIAFWTAVAYVVLRKPWRESASVNDVH